VVGTHDERLYVLTLDGREAVTRAYVDAATDRVPVIAGVGAVTTRAAIENAKTAERARADAISTVAPYFISPTSDELYRHFRTIH
jgi:4-hydroxy-tetrahydrodipicolinate synthase